MTKKILFALAIIVFLPKVFAAANDPETVFTCGQDFQRELTFNSNKDFVLAEGFSRGGKDMVSSHAYFFVRDMNFRLSKGTCHVELKAQNIQTPTERVHGKRAFYKFKFQFAKNDPTTLTFQEDGKASVTCTVAAKYLSRLKNCNMAPEIPEAMVCQSSVVQGTQIKTVFRIDPKTGASERQVYKLTLADASAAPTSTTSPSSLAAATPTISPAPKILKEEDLGVRAIKYKWSMVDKVCQLKVNEADENQDQLMDFVLKMDGAKPSMVFPAYFNKMRISLDKDHVADLLDDKKNVQCVLSPELLRQAGHCASVTAKDEASQKSKEKKSRKHPAKKTSASNTF